MQTPNRNPGFSQDAESRAFWKACVEAMLHGHADLTTKELSNITFNADTLRSGYLARVEESETKK